MTLHELADPQSLSTFVSSNHHSLVCFSATWCGPCKASKPQLEALASSCANDPSIDVACGIVYEHSLGDEIHAYKVKAFPTYALFAEGGSEVGRVQGVDFEGIRALISKHCARASFGGEGKSLGGGGAPIATSAADARAQRLARFGGGGNGNTPDAASASASASRAAGPLEDAGVEDEAMEDVAPPAPPAATKTEEGDATTMDVVDEKSTGEDASSEGGTVDPADSLKPEDVTSLTESMGFSLIRAQKGLLNGNGTVEGAVEWLLEHQEDDDIDEPIERVPKKSGAGGGGPVAISYKCVATGKIFANMADLELHANRTGHSDFEETTERKKPLSPEEKAAKILEIKSLLKAKRAERELVEKAEDVDREKQRRFMGQEMSKTREQMEIEERKRMANTHKREKENAIKERARIRAELEKDKRERMANKGKLSSKLGVDGYNPDAIQYDYPGAGGGGGADTKGEGAAGAAPKTKKAPPSVAKIDEYVAKVSSYRAGGDGGNCLKILKAYLGNVTKNPDDPKYRRINTENKAYKTKVKPLLGAKPLLLCVGFVPTKDGTAMELAEDADMAVLKMAEEKVDAAYVKYMK